MFNYRNPSPRRVWKVGSELQFTTSLPVDPPDPPDRAPCRKVVFRLRETLTFQKIVPKAPRLSTLWTLLTLLTLSTLLTLLTLSRVSTVWTMSAVSAVSTVLTTSIMRTPNQSPNHRFCEDVPSEGAGVGFCARFPRIRRKRDRGAVGRPISSRADGQDDVSSQGKLRRVLDASRIPTSPSRNNC